jgi:hypothetical protein
MHDGMEEIDIVQKQAFDEARDALHIMPLSIVPLKTRGLRTARLIKNARFDTRIELFRDASSGSGQVPLSGLDRVFPSDVENLKSDQPILSKLGSLPAFDVYSLRIACRRLDIPVENEEGLSLSPAKKAELTEYMRGFTRPLIQYIYGENDTTELNDLSDIMARLRTPDRAEAKKRLQFLSDKLGVDAMELPRFLEDYGDVFLSLAYFKKILDRLAPTVEGFCTWADGISESEMIRRDKQTMELLETVKSALNQTIMSITGRFETFNLRSRILWSDMTRENFHSFRDLVTSNHASIGGVLCGLTVKLDLWHERFPSLGGGPAKRAEFLRTEMYHGLHRLMQEEQTAAKALGA